MYHKIIECSEVAYRQAANIKQLHDESGYWEAYRYARSLTTSKPTALTAIRNALRANPPGWKGQVFIGYKHNTGNYVAIGGKVK